MPLPDSRSDYLLAKGRLCYLEDESNPRFRFPTSAERREAKRHGFSKCTLPVVIFSDFLSNFGGESGE
jgi:hypothetical protein